MMCCARVGGGLARLGLEALDEVGGVAPRVGLDLLQEQLARLLGGEPGDALQLALAVGEDLVARGPRRRRARFWASATASSRVRRSRSRRVGGGDAIRERAGLLGERLFQAGDLQLARPRLALGVGDDGVRLLAGLELGFFLEGLGVARGLLAQDARPVPRRGRWSRRRSACRLAIHQTRAPSVTISVQTETTPKRYTADGAHRVTCLSVNGGDRRRLFLGRKRPRFAVWGGRLNLG